MEMGGTNEAAGASQRNPGSPRRTHYTQRDRRVFESYTRPVSLDRPDDVLFTPAARALQPGARLVTRCGVAGANP